MCFGRTPIALIGDEIEKRTGCRIGIQIAAIVQLISGICIIALWALMLVEVADYPYPTSIKTYAGIWVGAVMFIPGIAGIVATASCTPNTSKAIAFYVLFGGSIATISVSSQLLRYAISAFKETNNKKLLIWPHSRQDLLASYSAAEIALGILVIVLAAVVIGLYMRIMCHVRQTCRGMSNGANGKVCGMGQVCPQQVGQPQAPPQYWDPNAQGAAQPGAPSQAPPPYGVPPPIAQPGDQTKYPL